MINEANRYEMKASALAKKIFGIVRNNKDYAPWAGRLLFLSAEARAHLHIAEERHIGLSAQANWIRTQIDEAWKICFHLCDDQPGPLTTETLKSKWLGMTQAAIRAMNQDITRYNAREEVGRAELCEHGPAPEDSGLKAELPPGMQPYHLDHEGNLKDEYANHQFDRAYGRLSHSEEEAPLTFQHAVFKGVLVALRTAYKEKTNLWKVFYYGPKKGLSHERLPKVVGLAWLQKARINGHLSGPQYRGLMNIVTAYSPAAKDMPESREVTDLDAKEAEAKGLGERVDMEFQHLAAPDLNPEEMYINVQEGNYDT